MKIYRSRKPPKSPARTLPSALARRVSNFTTLPAITPAGAYPAILIMGWVRGKYGVWRSEDDAATWTQIGDFPLGILDQVGAISGDGDDPTQVYLGFRGAGYATSGGAPASSH